MNTLKVASIQMNSTSNWKNNLKTAISLIKQASSQGTKLIVLPEFFIQIGENTPNHLSEIAEEIGIGKIQDALKKVAKDCNIFLVAGTIPIKSKVVNKYYNTTFVYNPDGDMICYYNKIHLFNLEHPLGTIDENINFEHGEDIVTFNINNFSFGIAICYDLRFPELFREMSGVDAVIIPAAFTYYTGQFHWEILLRARAIENQCYIIASAQTGTHEDKRHTYGHSMIIEPWGQIEASLPEGEGFITVELKKDVIAKVRTKLPALQHRKI